MFEILYTLFIGLPLCLFCCMVGVFLRFTIIGLPLGLTYIALGFKALSYPEPTHYTIRIDRR